MKKNMKKDYTLPIETMPKYDPVTRTFRNESVYEDWKKAYYSINPVPTEEEQSWIDMLTNLVPSVLPFHLQIVDHIPNAMGDYHYTNCLIRITKGTRKHPDDQKETINTAIHELCHHISWYHNSFTSGSREHSRYFTAAIKVLETKRELMYSDFDPIHYPSIEELRKSAGKNMTANELYSLHDYQSLTWAYSRPRNKWNIDTLCELFGVDLKHGKILDR